MPEKTFSVIHSLESSTFGIRACSGEVTPYVFATMQSAQRAESIFNAIGLSPLHLRDVLEDLIKEKLWEGQLLITDLGDRWLLDV